APAGHDQLALDDLAGTPRAGHQRPLDLVDDPSHEVLPVERLPGGRTDLAEDHEPGALAADDRHEEEEVRDAEVGQHPPPPHEAAEVGVAVLRHLVQLGRGHRYRGTERGRRPRYAWSEE